MLAWTAECSQDYPNPGDREKTNEQALKGRVGFNPTDQTRWSRVIRMAGTRGVCRPFRAWIANDLLYRGSAIATPRPVVCQPFGLAILKLYHNYDSEI